MGRPITINWKILIRGGVRTAHNTVSARPMYAGAPPPENDVTTKTFASHPTQTPSQKAASAALSRHETAPAASEAFSGTSQFFFYEVLEESGNTLEVAKREAVDPLGPGFDPSSFKVFSAEGEVTLEWTAGPNARFNILRSQSEDGGFIQINGEIISSPQEESDALKYHYTDTTAVEGTTYYFKLERISPEGDHSMIGPVPATAQIILGKADPADRTSSGFPLPALSIRGQASRE